MLAKSPGYRSYREQQEEKAEIEKATKASQSLVSALVEVGLVGQSPAPSQSASPTAVDDWLQKAITAGWVPPPPASGSASSGTLPPFPPVPPQVGPGVAPPAVVAPAAAAAVTTGVTAIQKDLIETLGNISIDDNSDRGVLKAIKDGLKNRDTAAAVKKFIQKKGKNSPKDLDARAKLLVSIVKGL